MRPALRIQGVISCRTPDAEHRRKLQQLAIFISDSVQALVGHESKEKLLDTPANVVPLFLQAKLTSRHAKVVLVLNWQQQAQLTTHQAVVLSAYLQSCMVKKKPLPYTATIV